MFAPRRVPPCLTSCVAWLMMLSGDSAPLATPFVLRTGAPRGRTLQPENPVPPPLLWMSMVCLTKSPQPSMLSSIGST